MKLTLRKGMLILGMAVCMSSVVMAQDNNSSSIEQVQETQDEVKVVNLTREQFIKRLSEVRGIPFAKAEAQLNSSEGVDESSRTIMSRSSSVDTYYQEWVGYSEGGLGYRVEAGALVKIESSGSFRGLVGVEEVWTNASGSGDYTWSESYVSPVNVTANGLTLKWRGVIEVAVEKSVSGGYSAAGFEMGGSVGSTTYARKTISDQKTFKLYN